MCHSKLLTLVSFLYASKSFLLLFNKQWNNVGRRFSETIFTTSRSEGLLLDAEFVCSLIRSFVPSCCSSPLEQQKVKESGSTLAWDLQNAAQLMSTVESPVVETKIIVAAFAFCWGKSFLRSLSCSLSQQQVSLCCSAFDSDCICPAAGG